jgi:hypothetical protein
MRRVVEISDSKSGNSRANALFCALDLLVVFRTGFFADFFADLLDFFDLLEDLERADALAMSDFDGKGPQ